MGNNVIVCAGCTHMDGLIQEYVTQLDTAGVPYHIALVDPMPAGPNSMTMRRKIGFVREMAERHMQYDAIYITDAWDVLFFGTLDDLRHETPEEGVLFSAERNAYPESDLDGVVDIASPWRYTNAGLMCGSPTSLLCWAREVEAFGDLDILDQAWLNRRLFEHSPLFTIDVFTRVFYTVSPDREDGSLKVVNGRLCNTTHLTYPSFFHFSGNCPTDGVRKMLGESQ